MTQLVSSQVRVLRVLTQRSDNLNTGYIYIANRWRHSDTKLQSRQWILEIGFFLFPQLKLDIKEATAISGLS